MKLDRSFLRLLLGYGLAYAFSAVAQTQSPAAPAEGVRVPWVAGAQRVTRPDGAPQVNALEVTRALQRRRLSGVSEPWPGNLAVIARQGAWYSPMFGPGMTGPYDLRAWHPAPP